MLTVFWEILTEGTCLADKRIVKGPKCNNNYLMDQNETNK
jgi:hypothetical protein